eukprot:391100_1
MLAFWILNGIIATILFIYGCFIIFAIIQDYHWNKKFTHYWLYIPQMIPCFTTAICFYIYLAGGDDKYTALIASIIQFPWVYSSTYSMFVADENMLEMSQEIYIEYDIKILTDFNDKMQALPQNKYLVYGMFRLLKSGYNFTTFIHTEKLPKLHPHVADIIALYLDADKSYSCKVVDTEWEMMQVARILFAKKVTFLALISILIIYITIICMEIFMDLSMLFDCIIGIIVLDVVFLIFHVRFTVCTTKVLIFLHTYMPDMDTRKYKVALISSLSVMVLEIAACLCFLFIGIEENVWIHCLIVAHTLSIWAWYTNWIYEQIRVSMGSY